MVYSTEKEWSTSIPQNMAESWKENVNYKKQVLDDDI